MTFSLVGSGRVGGSLARWAVALGATAETVGGRPGSQSARGLASDLGAALVPVAELASGGEGLLLVAVPDTEIAGLAERLASRPQARVALHSAGRFGAAALAPLRRAGSAVGSLHPLRSFPRVEASCEAARDTFYAVDGDEPAEALARRLAGAFGGVAGRVEEADRPLYHLAATLAAGGAVTLLALAHELAGRIGLPAAAADGYGKLASDALAAARAVADPRRALTGPAARGDLAAIHAALAGLARVAPERLGLATAVLAATLDQIALAGPLDERQAALARALASPDFLDLARDRMLTS